jgi:signal transduction histidine kinase
MRLYLRFYLALVLTLFAFALIAALFWHVYTGVPPPRHAPRAGIAFLLIVAATIALAAFPAVRIITGRLERLQRATEALAGGDFTARVPVEGTDEVATLATTFNQAAARIEQLVGAQRLFLAQASHELRTPVTRIRLALDLAKDIEPERRRGLERDIAELDDLIEEILLASRLDTFTQLQHREAVDFLALVAEECARYDVTDFEGDPVHLQGDSRLLARLVRNLLENARHHGQPPVRVRLRSRDGATVLAVTDAGPGIPEGERDMLFTAFHRGGDGKGHGLGLSLVRQIARQHGGDVRYGAVEELAAQGFVVTLHS